MKKLAILINSMNGGGAERVVSILLQELIQHYDVFLVVLHTGIAYKIPKEVQVYRLSNVDLNATNFWKTALLPYLGYKYARFCQKNKIDISLSLLNRANYINVLSKSFGAHHRTIISERAVTTEEYPTISLKGKISRLLIRKLYPKADEIISISKGIAKDLAHVFKIKPGKITTIYNPVDLQSLERKETHHSIKKNYEFTFIAIGRLDETKNFQLLLQAFAELNHAKAKLILLGDGPQRKKLQAMIEKLSLEDKVSMPGAVDNIFTYLNLADCFVMSSSSEGFGNVIIEALACGKAVIATDCKYGPSEILAGKLSPATSTDSIYRAQYGILVPLNNPTQFANAMHEMIKNTLQRETYEKRGPERANHFDKNLIIPQYIHVLENRPL